MYGLGAIESHQGSSSCNYFEIVSISKIQVKGDTAKAYKKYPSLRSSQYVPSSRSH